MKNFLLMKSILILTLLLVFITFSFAGGQKDSGDSKSYVFGVDSTWPPMEFVDTDANEIVGFSIDLLNAIAREVGIEVAFETVAWDGIFTGLMVGNYDGISSSVTITEERQEKMLFSDPYFNAGQILAIRKADSEKYKSLQDLVGKEVGAQIATTGASEISKVSGIILKSYDNLGIAAEELANETIEGIVADTPLVADYLLKNKKFEGIFTVAGQPMTTEEYGFVFSLDNTELKEKIDQGLAKVRASGEYDKIYAKWIQ